MAIVIIIAFSVSIIINQYISIRKLKLDNEIAKLSIKEIRNNYELRIRLSECGSSQMDALKEKNVALLLENMRNPLLTHIGMCMVEQAKHRRFQKIQLTL